MPRRRGLQAEILASLALVMVTATTLLAALLVKTHEASMAGLQQLAGRGLLEVVRSDAALVATEGVELWHLPSGKAPRAVGGHDGRFDAASQALAEAAREQRRMLLQAGPPWEPVRFAAPSGDPGSIVVAVIPAAISRGWLLGLLVGDIVVFTAFGATLLRQRLVIPLERLAAAARGLADGDRGVRAPVDGPEETARLGSAFNEMTEVLERRTEALEKAVVDLRESNRSLREARAGLDRAERLAAVGQLAAGVAHEVGNPMGALLAFVDLARRDPGLSAASRAHLESAGTQGQRVRGILRQLLDFSKPRRGEPERVDVAALCEETAGLIRAQRRYAGVAIEVASEPGTPPAWCDRATLAQIVLNLLLNAGDALRDPAVGGGHVRIRLRPAAFELREGEPAGAAASRASFDAVECRIADDGPGIPAELRERIFAPFFTTKAPGEGTGLGLANALRCAEELGGRLELSPSAAGEGAVFRLLLPARRPERTSPTARSAA